VLYERGIIDISLPFSQLKAQSLINTQAKAADQDPAFSQRIRMGLPNPRDLTSIDEADKG
jgi:hypothetical protein